MPPHPSPDEPPLLDVQDLRVSLPLREGLLVGVDGVSFRIGRGQTLGLVGESGCGKTMTAQSILRITPRRARVEGRILLRGGDGDAFDVASLDPAGPDIRHVRGGVASMVFQEPMTSFSPLHTIGNQIVEAIRLHRTRDKRQARDLAADMLSRVGIPQPVETLAKYPHHLSGGMRQRAMIAMALSSRPSLLIADEPTTALDVTVQAQVLQLMRDLQAEMGMGILYISHDLGVIANMANDVAVMYLGQIVEHTDVNRLFAAPKHPYTQALMRAIPRMGKISKQRLESIKGAVPVPINKPAACGFFSRCPSAMPGTCDRTIPALVEVAPSHRARCFLYPEVIAASSIRAAA